MADVEYGGGNLITQLRKRGIRDQRVLRAMENVPRELFVSPSLNESAYLDMALPIACGQTISQPFIVAYMTERLDPREDDEVLEVGTGSGYQAAILARLCGRVFSIERHKKLNLDARERLARLGVANVTLTLGDGSQGWPEPRVFDRIIVTAAATETPVLLLKQLAVGGRLIAPVGTRPERQRLIQFDRTATGIDKRELLPVRFVPLVEDESS